MATQRRSKQAITPKLTPKPKPKLVSRGARRARPDSPTPTASGPRGPTTLGPTRAGVTDVAWALRDLLWLAAWNAGDGPDVADADLASRHARLLEDVVERVKRHYDQTTIDHAKRSPVRTRDGFLLAVANGIRSILATCTSLASSAATSNQAAAEVVDRIKSWLDAWHANAREPNVALSRLEHEINASKGIGGIASWITEVGGPAEATAQLLDKLGGVGRTRLVELRAYYGGPDNDVDDQLKRRYGHSGLQPREIREFAMRLVGFDDKAIAAAQAKQPEPFELDFFFGTWLC